MGTVSHYLRDLIAKQIKEHGIVVWFDPDKRFATFIHELGIPDTKVFCYEGSFFALRHDVEPFIGGLEPPRLLVYVPLSEGETHHALAELAAAGVVIQPGQQPPTRNTRLSVLARNALKPIIGEQAAVEIEKQVENKKLSLADLDRLAEEGKGISSGVVSVIYDSANPMHVALTFLSSPSHDAEVTNKSASRELVGLLQSAFGIEFPADEALASMRLWFARHVLATDFISQLEGKLPDKLVSVRIAPTDTTRESCLLLTRNWRNGRPCRGSYVDYANQVEHELNLAQIQWNLKQIAKVETFQEIEKGLLKAVEANLLHDPEDEFIELARRRQSSFWSECVPDLQAHWALVAAAGQVLLEARRIEKEMKTLPPGFETIVQAYTESERPWCLLDTFHRHMERRWRELRRHNFTEMVDRHFSFGSHLNARDVKAVRKTVAGLIKLIFPHGEITKEELAEIIELALEGRRRVKEQLKKMGSFEYHQTSFSYVDSETREERFVGVLESGGRELISPDPLSPGSVYVSSVDDQAKVGLYRLEIGTAPGTGKLKVAGGIEGAMKESIQRAYAYIQGHKDAMGIAQAVDITDFHVEAIALLTNRVPCEAGVGLVVAIYSSLKKHAVLPGLIVVGDLSIQGHIKAARSIAESLQTGMENGAKRALIPLENKRHFLEVSSDVVEKVDPIFFSDPLTAAVKALGIN